MEHDDRYDVQDVTRPVPGVGVEAGEPATGESMHQPAKQPEDRPARPRGPHAPTLLLGLVALLVAALAIARQVTGFTVSWSGFGPALVIGAGVVLLLVGLAGFARQRG